MIAKAMEPLVFGDPGIGAMFDVVAKMVAEYGEENVYNFSIGNPSEPAPEEVKEAIKAILDEEPMKRIPATFLSSIEKILSTMMSMTRPSPSVTRKRYGIGLFASLKTTMVSIGLAKIFIAVSSHHNVIAVVDAAVDRRHRCIDKNAPDD